MRFIILPGHVAPNVITDVQSGVSLHGDKPKDVVSIRQSPHRQLSAVRQTRLAQTLLQLFFQMFQKSFKVDFCPFVANSFINMLAPKPLNL